MVAPAALLPKIKLYNNTKRGGLGFGALWGAWTSSVLRVYTEMRRLNYSENSACNLDGSHCLFSSLFIVPTSLPQDLSLLRPAGVTPVFPRIGIYHLRPRRRRQSVTT